MDSVGFSIPPLPVNQTHRNIKTTPAFPIRALAPLLGSIALINLGGDFTATGNVAITNAGYTGPNLNAINLSAGQHTFSIAAGTTTTVAPEISGTGGLTKTGNGTLTLTTLSASNYTGDTIVTQGTLLTTPAQVAAAVIIGGGATLGVNLDTGGTTLLTSNLTTAANSTLVLATGAFGNPTAPVVATGPLTINGTTTLRITGSALTAANGIPIISYGSTGVWKVWADWP